MAVAARGSEVWTRGAIHAVNSPTRGTDLPPFQFSKIPATFNISWDGLQDRWDGFGWIEFDDGSEGRCANYKGKNECTGEAFCGWCGDSALCLPGQGTGPLFGANCSGRWSVNHIDWLVMGAWVGGFGALVVVLAVALLYFRFNPVDTGQLLAFHTMVEDESYH
jgi:hypothetical protein